MTWKAQDSARYIYSIADVTHKCTPGASRLQAFFVYMEGVTMLEHIDNYIYVLWYVIGDVAYESWAMRVEDDKYTLTHWCSEGDYKMQEVFDTVDKLVESMEELCDLDAWVVLEDNES